MSKGASESASESERQSESEAGRAGTRLQAAQKKPRRGASNSGPRALRRCVLVHVVPRPEVRAV